MKEEKKREGKLGKADEQRQKLVDMILHNLENGNKLWEQGWSSRAGMPESAITGKKYRGVNNVLLTFVALSKGWLDNRWATYRQIEEKGWTFKKDENGESLAKKNGVSICFYELMDKQTGKPFDRHTLDGMTEDEKTDYKKENVYALRRTYTVFNGDLIEGLPEREKTEMSEEERVKRAERLIGYWSEHESEIIYSGNSAFYSPTTDKIYLPKRGDFYSTEEFYGTALHEMSHSTGHETRLNRVLGKSGTPEYAKEELRAEFASMFLEQELGISMDDNHIENNSAYIKSWYEAIKDDPNVLFTAIADAEKISRFIMSKEALIKKRTEPYAVTEEETEFGEAEYALHLASDYGQTRIRFIASTKEELMENLEWLKSAPYWSDTEFEEVSLEELEEISISRAKTEEAEAAKSDIYLPPSEIVAKSLPKSVPIDMSERGEERLTRMSDREIVEKAKNSTGKETFTRLYNGEAVLGSEEKDEKSLMSRLAMYAEDKGQLLRVFRSSGQYRDEKPNGYYEKMADDSILFISRIREIPAVEKESERKGRVKLVVNEKG